MPRIRTEDRTFILHVLIVVAALVLMLTHTIDSESGMIILASALPTGASLYPRKVSPAPAD